MTVIEERDTAPSITDMTAPVPGPARTLPVADQRAVRHHTWQTLRRHRRQLGTVIWLHALAALASLAAPRIIGELVDSLSIGTTREVIDRLALVLGAAVIAQTVLTWFARRASFVLGETVFADLREQFMTRVVALPLSTVERAGTGDLVSRTTNDVEALSHVVRFGLPSIFVAVVTIVIYAVAALVTGWQVALAIVVGVPLMVWSTKWYLRYAPAGYLRERAAYAVLNGVVTESVDGARTVDALGLGPLRRRRMDKALRDCVDIEVYTLGLRMKWFPAVEFGYIAPIAVVLGWGGWLVSRDVTTIGTVTAVALYVQLLGQPLDELLSWLDEIQVGATSLARVIGIADVPSDRTATGAVPEDDEIVVREVRYAYRTGRDVLHRVDLDIEPGERLAIVGPSGAGKSTLGRLLAGIDGPREGRVDVGGVPLVDLTLPELRGQVALVSQEHHVFVGTLRDNLELAAPDADTDQLLAALQAVDATDWVSALPAGLDTRVGAGGHLLTEGQSQQLALARLVLADPHTLVLDEATSLLDPRAARHLERSLAAVVQGRTVIAIAHRLHTAHDADRVAVVDGGVITEIGSHDELIAAQGAYADLWHSWRND